jgi:hypothetical protein
MGKTAKRQNKKAANQAAREATVLGTRGAGTGRKGPSKLSSFAAAAAADAANAAPSDAMNVQETDTVTVRKPSATSLGRISRAVEADLVQEACVALDNLLAEVERGDRADAAPMALCSRVLTMCQRHGKAKPALRLLQRMELCGMPVGPVQLRQVFFACCGKVTRHRSP